MMDIGRREVLKKIYNIIVAVGAANFITFEDLIASTNNDKNSKLQRPKIVWLHASSCSGCSCAFLDIEDVSVVDILTQFTQIIYHPDISLCSGNQVTDILTQIAKQKDDYIFILEGSIPLGMPHACMMGDKPISYWVELLAKNSIASIAAGTCAAFGGITAMDGMYTGTVTLGEFLKKKNINKPIVNLPNCPMRPEHLVYTLLHYGRFQTLPTLDRQNRPNRFFARSVHERCILYSEFQEKNFAKKIGERGCLHKLGCQGPVTKNDCLTTGHNGNTNTCIRAGHPCIGCASEHFPRKMMYHIFGDERMKDEKA